MKVRGLFLNNKSRKTENYLLGWFFENGGIINTQWYVYFIPLIFHFQAFKDQKIFHSRRTHQTKYLFHISLVFIIFLYVISQDKQDGASKHFLFSVKFKQTNKPMWGLFNKISYGKFSPSSPTNRIVEAEEFEWIWVSKFTFVWKTVCWFFW